MNGRLRGFKRITKSHHLGRSPPRARRK